MNDTKIIIAVLLVTIMHQSSALFFGPTESTCRSDRDCSGTFSSNVGKCIDKRNGLCDIGNFFGGKNECSYKTCATCFNDVDCPGQNYCSLGSCIYRSRSYRRYRG